MAGTPGRSRARRHWWSRSGKLTVAGRSLSLQQGVTQPLVEQHLVVNAGDLSFSGDAAHARAESVSIDLADSSIALHGVRLRTGPDTGAVGVPRDGAVVAVDSIHMGGIHLAELTRGKAVRMGRVTVGTVDVEVHHTATPKDSSVREPDREAGQKEGTPLTIAELRIPVAHFRYVDLKPDGTRSEISVKKVSVTADTLSISPGASRESRVRHKSRHAVITADGIVLSDNPMSSFTVASVAASLTDSTARVRGVFVGPTVSDSLWVSRQQHRTDRIRFRTDSVLFAGLDFDRLLLGDGLWVRHERVFGFDIDVFTDKNLKPNPTDKKHSSAQTDVQSIKFPFGIDTVSVIDGEVVYHELDVGKPEPGEVSFTAITASITGFTSRGSGREESAAPHRDPQHALRHGQARRLRHGAAHGFRLRRHLSWAPGADAGRRHQPVRREIAAGDDRGWPVRGSHLLGAIGERPRHRQHHAGLQGPEGPGPRQARRASSSGWSTASSRSWRRSSSFATTTRRRKASRRAWARSITPSQVNRSSSFCGLRCGTGSRSRS